MKVIVQRVSSAKCVVDQNIISSIENGYVLLVGFTHEDTEVTLDYVAKKIAKLRIFEDENGKMNIDIKEKGFQILSIPQFTLYGDPKKGNRPSFVDAMIPKKAQSYYDLFNEKLRSHGIEVYTGAFQSHMEIHLVNDGPVTIIVER
jgi:D-tyrosyl-tRNA(Tyr) deacylase